MQINGNHVFPQPPAEVYAMFLDPVKLRTAMPGCERLEPTGPDKFDVALSVPVPAVKGEYAGTIHVVDQDPPRSFKMKIDVKGKGGFVTADALMRVEPKGEGTLVTYEADAQVGGPAAGVGQRVLTGITRRQIAQMMATMEQGKRPSAFARLKQWLRSKLGKA
jgi:carbon monoxide dehydrogenase subunit G